MNLAKLQPESSSPPAGSPVPEHPLKNEGESPSSPESVAKPQAGTSDFQTIIQKILGRDPTRAESEEFYRVRDALHLRDNDALWMILLLLQCVRRDLEQSVADALSRIKSTADAVSEAAIKAAKADFLKNFPAELSKAAEQVTRKATGDTGPVVITGLIVGLVLLIAGFSGIGWLAYDLGERSGYEKGVLAERAAKPAESAKKQ